MSDKDSSSSSSSSEEEKETKMEEKEEKEEIKESKKEMDDSKVSDPDEDPTWKSHLFPHGEFQVLSKDEFWIIEGSLKNGLKRNMVVYKMRTGGLMLHSVVALNKEGMKQLESFGKPEVILIPNNQHTIDAGIYKKRYPDAKIISPKPMVSGLQKKGLVVEQEASEIPKDTGITSMVTPGFKQKGGAGVGGEMVYEVQLKDGIGIIFCDIITNNVDAKGLIGVLFGGDFKSPRLLKWLLVKDKSKAKQFLLDLAAKENIKAICVAHGSPITKDASEALKEAAKKSFN